MFSCEFSKISNNTFFHRTSLVDAFDYYVQYVKKILSKTTIRVYWFISSWIVNILWKIFCRIKLSLQICKSLLITSLTGFRIAFTDVETTLKQRRNKVVSTLFQRCLNIGHRRCIDIVQRPKSDVGFGFIFHVGSTLFQRWSTTLKQRWSDVDMLAGTFN